MVYPIAFESFDLGDYDVVISNSSAFCKGVVTGPNTLHISYCLTPMRWVWRYREYVERERLGALARMMLPPLIHYLRVWDAGASSRVDRYVAISTRRGGPDSQVLPPRRRDHLPARRLPRSSAPPGPPGDYYMTVGRLTPYQRKDLIVDAFRELGLPVKIVGDGRDRARLQARADAEHRVPRPRRRRDPARPVRQLPGLPLPRRRGLRDRAGRGAGGRSARGRLRGRRRARHGDRRRDGRPFPRADAGRA